MKVPMGQIIRLVPEHDSFNHKKLPRVAEGFTCEPISGQFFVAMRAEQSVPALIRRYKDASSCLALPLLLVFWPLQHGNPGYQRDPSGSSIESVASQHATRRFPAFFAKPSASSEKSSAASSAVRAYLSRSRFLSHGEQGV